MVVRRLALVLSLSVTLATAACRAPSRTDAGGPVPVQPRVAVAGGELAPVVPQALPPTGPVHAAAAADDRAFGAPTVLGNLAIYPVLSKTQVDVGPLVALDEALAKGDAEIRETSGGGTVNQLTIENKGTTPILVLAGTIVKGGKQDRQIGQDFILEGKTAAPVDAFCVEQHRWDAHRNGQATSGKFTTSDVIALSKVRAAGQYKKDQSEVWSSVSSTNTTHAKRAESGTLMATIDDAAIKKERAALAGQIDQALATATPQADVVGIAYAIDGEVRGARWFTHHRVFELARNKVVAGIALDAMTATAEAKRLHRPPTSKPTPKSTDVDAFVKNVEAEPVKEERVTPAANTNAYKESSEGFGSRTMTKGSPGKKATTVSVDYVKK